MALVVRHEFMVSNKVLAVEVIVTFKNLCRRCKLKQ